MGRGPEQRTIVAELEVIAQRLGDPLIRSQVLRQRVQHEINAERLDVADALADEALRWARAADDDWEVAEASRGKAVAASSIADLRERVDAAASLLSDVGNVHQLASLLNSAAYAALCLGGEGYAADFAARATPIAHALDDRFERMINMEWLGPHQCQQAVVVGAAGRAPGEMHGDRGEPGAGAPSAELGLDVALEHRAGGSAAGVGLIDLEELCEGDATARQDMPPTTAASPPASSTLRLRSTPCEATV
jgi:hypothetical protein